mgnify:CR=1 FL=1
MNPASDIVCADWPAPAGIRAVTTRRSGGISAAPFDTLNLGDHVGDTPEAVTLNRARLVETLALPSAPAWLHQVHGTRVIDLDQETGAGIEADAAVTRDPARVLAILTALTLSLILALSTVVDIGHFIVILSVSATAALTSRCTTPTLTGYSSRHRTTASQSAKCQMVFRRSSPT